MGLKKAFAFLRREICVFFWIALSGAALVVLAMLLLLVRDTWENPSKIMALIGTKVLIFGYPAFILFRLLKQLILQSLRK